MRQVFSEMAEMDALLLPAERGACWTLLHPSYPVVVPQPNLVEVPIAYPVARRDQKLAQFMTRWIELKQGDGTLDALDEYWIKSSFFSTRRRRRKQVEYYLRAVFASLTWPISLIRFGPPVSDR